MKQNYSRKIFFLLIAIVLLIQVSVRAQNVSLVASGGTTTGSYPTLSAAFAMINNGTHQGAITLSIVNDIIAEPAGPTALGASLVGAANYTSVTIVPVGNRILQGAANNNRSVIELFGADNVTIDGDDPSTAGKQNLSILVNTGSFNNNTSAIRIGSVSATNPCQDIKIKNCIIKGGRLASSQTIDNAGIIVGSNNTANIFGGGANNRDITIENNDISRGLHGILLLGLTGTENKGIKILKNKIGVNASAAENIGRWGIFTQFSSGIGSGNATEIDSNEIVVGLNTSTGLTGGSIGINVSDGNSQLVIKNNHIHDIINNIGSVSAVFPPTHNVAGIQIVGAANNNLNIYNNIIRDVISARKQLSIPGDANYGIYMLNFGLNARVHHNTIGLITANAQGVTANALSLGILIHGNGVGTMADYSNNIIVNKNASTAAFCVFLNSIAAVANATMNKNCYYFPNGSCGNSGAPFTLTNWQTVTSRDLQSFVENPPFKSTTNLLITPGIVTQLESNSAGSILNVDIENDNRPGPIGSVNGGATSPDIGADEFDGIKYVPPVILNTSHDPIAQACASQPRVIDALFSTLGNALDSVMVEYSVNGGAKTTLKMNPAGPTGFTKTIPSVVPLMGTVQYRVYAMTKLNDTITSNYNYYNDNTANAALHPVLSANPAQACPTSSINLNYTFLPDPTGFNFPPTVASPTTNVDITNVKLITIDNTTAINSLTGSIGTATGLVGEYSNFRNFTVDTFSLGRSYPVFVTSNATGPLRTYFSGFADFNGDGDFNDVGENLFNTIQVKVTGGRTERFNLYIPPNARPGKTCIRIICSAAPILNAYTNLNLGEIEEYSIYVRPLKYTWMTGATVIGTNNPQPYVVATLPNTVYVEIQDSATVGGPCLTQTIGKVITQAPTGLNVTISAPTSACYNVPSLVTANVTGGCPPYSYTWTNTSLNQSSQLITLSGTNLSLTVTVVDKNGSTYSATATIVANNPQLASPFPPDTQIICNRGTTKFTVNTATTDSAYWYSSSAAGPYSFDTLGKSFTTPTLSDSRAFYVAAFRSTSVFAGKPNLTGTTVVSASPHPLNSGLKFTAVEPIQILNCQMYYQTGTTPTMNIGLLDKYGSIITQTGLFTPPTAASAAVATTVPLNFIIPNPDTGFRIVLLAANNITALTRNSSGAVYPLGPTLPMIITGAYSVPLPASADYFYFYNFKILKGMCVGEKRQVYAKVRPPVVPAIKTDLAYTLMCKGDTLKLKIVSDTFGNKFVWTKNDINLPDYSVLPLSDTSTKDSLRIPNTGPSDTGLYRVRIFSSKYCTRDTFSREIRVSFHPEPIVKKTLPVTNLCVGTAKLLEIEVENGYRYEWKKNNVPIDTFYVNGNKYLDTVLFTDAGSYRVYVSDTNKCRTDSSIFNQVNVYNHPSITLHPIDTVLCENDRYVIYAKASNATNYQWYHDNGIMNSFTKDSLTIYNATINDSGTYRLKASSYPGCIDAITNIAKITVNPVPKIFGIYPPLLNICEGTKLKLIANTKDVLNVQWLKNNNPTGVTSDSFIVNNSLIATSGTYKFIAKSLNKCKDLSSDTTLVAVIKKPVVSGTLPNITLCEGGELKGGYLVPSGSIYQWYKNNIPLQGAIDSQLKIRFVGMSDTGRYFVKVNTHAVCAEATSSSFRLSVQPAPVIDIQPVGTTACMGANLQLVVVSRNGNGFQWKKDGVILGGAITNTHSIANLSAAKEGAYTVTVKGIAPCSDIESDTAKVIHRSGNTHAHASLVSIYNAIEQCTDVNNWTYYSPQDDESKYIFAIKKNGNVFTGKTDVVVRPGVFMHVNNTANEYTATLMMKRFWNFKLESGDLIDPIDVKFYYNKSEEDELRLKVLEIKNLYNNELTLENSSMRWFKTDSLPFTNTTLNLIRGNNLGFPVIDFGLTLSGIENNTPYIELRNMTNIGGGSAIHTFKGAPRVINQIVNGQTYSASIYPNPNNGNFTLSVVAKKAGKMNLSVVNQLGQTVYVQYIKLNGLYTDTNISVPNLSTGVYQLIMTKDDETTAIKFQVEN